jgi:hypothetical protein
MNKVNKNVLLVSIRDSHNRKFLEPIECIWVDEREWRVFLYFPE